MRISVLTMFPELFGDFSRAPVIARQLKAGRLDLRILDIKGFAPGSFRRIDDSPYGGGAGMILRCQPVIDALRAARQMFETDKSQGQAETGTECEKGDRTLTIALEPAGKPFGQQMARRFSSLDHLILICGHYEGIDARIYEYVDEIVSIGDYVLTGGELPAMVLTDAVVRLTEGALRRESTAEESFENGILEYPQYTRPVVFEGKEVPPVLLSGNHEEIRKWRHQAALERTAQMRPDLLAGYSGDDAGPERKTEG